VTLADLIRSRKSGISVVEFAEIMGISKFSVYKLVKRGLPAIHLPGGNLRLDPQLTGDWVDAHTTVKQPKRK
jgi:predicted DNA-binding transcriptional regulator AlpA